LLVVLQNQSYFATLVNTEFADALSLCLRKHLVQPLAIVWLQTPERQSARQLNQSGLMLTLKKFVCVLTFTTSWLKLDQLVSRLLWLNEERKFLRDVGVAVLLKVPVLLVHCDLVLLLLLRLPFRKSGNSCLVATEG